MEVIPGILEKDWSEIERKIEIVKSFAETASQSSVAEANAAPAIHIDIIDGKFAPNTTFLDPSPFAKYSKEIFFELHMMVNNPVQYLKPFARAGFKRFLGHIEKMSDQDEFVAKAQELGEVGLVIDGITPVSNIKVPYGDLDCVLIMTIKAGQSRQEFVPEYLEKVRRIREKNKFLAIEVDGGINDKTIIQAKEDGATRFVSTTFIFNPLLDSSPQKQFSLLQSRINQ